MRCEDAQLQIVLAQYGELPDEQQMPLEQHLGACDGCRREWNAYLALNETLALDPVLEPSPNLLAASRMRLDDALDAMPARSWSQRLFGSAFRWLGYVTGAPALTTLLLGVGFLGGNAVTRYQVARQPHLPQPVIVSRPGAIASVSGVRQTPNSDLVQVDYNRTVPETVMGSLDDPEIRKLLMVGTQLASNTQAHLDSVSLLAQDCRIGHGCGAGADGVPDAANDVRRALLTALHYDKSPAVRLTALTGLQPYVAEDEHVRDGVLEALMHDRSEAVRTQAISMLSPVGGDTTVRQALRTVSAQDANPAIRNASFQVLQSASDIE